jgi:NAD(P)-dependent dehydrogenase (short-subunit alcohol dehydrogenase family)
MEVVVITGANRGIGLELTRLYLLAGKHVVAGCRQPDMAEALRNLAGLPGKLEIVQLDVSDAASVAALGKTLKGQPVELLINNAGVWGGPRQGIADMDYVEWLRTFETNTVAPFRLVATLLANLKLGKRPRVITVSSQMGAFNLKGMGVDRYAYRSSKAAVSKLMQTLAEELAPDGIIVCPVHPGWVRTDMGGPQAQLSVEESGSGLFRLIENLIPAQSGRFWSWDGSEHPW